MQIIARAVAKDIIGNMTTVVICQPIDSAIAVNTTLVATIPKDARQLSMPATVAPFPHLLNLVAMNEVVKIIARLS